MAREEYQAVLTITSEHVYIVTARSPEEATSNAEDLYRDGDMGEVLSSDVESADAIPLRDEPIEADDSEDYADSSSD